MQIDKKVRELYPDETIDYDEMSEDIFNQVNSDEYQEPVFDQSKDFVEPIGTTFDDVDQYDENINEDDFDIGYRQTKYNTDEMDLTDLEPKEYTERDETDDDVFRENDQSLGYYNMETKKIITRKPESIRKVFNKLGITNVNLYEKARQNRIHENFHNQYDLLSEGLGGGPLIVDEIMDMIGLDADLDYFIKQKVGEKEYKRISKEKENYFNDNIMSFINPHKYLKEKRETPGVKYSFYDVYTEQFKGSDRGGSFQNLINKYPKYQWASELGARETDHSGENIFNPKTQSQKNTFRRWFI